MDCQDHDMMEQPTSSEELPTTLASHSVSDNSLTKKGTPWSVDEHFQFLRGLERLGRGNWRGISRFFVHTRTPTQVASHAQKHFLRVGGNTKRRSRFAAIEEEVYGGLPPAELAMAAVPEKQHQRPTPALPPRVPHPPYSTGARPGALGAPGNGRSAPASQQQLSGQQQHRLVTGVHPPPFSAPRPSWEAGGEPNASAAPPASIWANPQPYMATAGSQPNSMAHESFHADTAWLGPMWPSAAGQPTSKATPTTTNSGSSGQHQHMTTNSGPMAPQRRAAPAPAAGVPVTEGPHGLPRADGPMMVPGYPAGAFFSMPAFMHPSMNPMMAYAMQAAGAAVENAHGAVQPSAVFSAAAQHPAAASTRPSPASSSSSQLEAAKAPAAALDMQQLSAGNSQTSQAGRHDMDRSVPCKPEPTVASWQPGSSTPSAIAPLLAQLQLAGTGSTRSMQLLPSRSSAFTPLAPAIRA